MNDKPTTKAVTVELLFKRQISFFQDLRRENNPICHETVSQILKHIKEGHWKDQVEQVANVHRNHGREAAQKLKKALPGVTFSGLFGRSRSEKDLRERSGLLCLDFDSQRLEQWTDALQNDPHVLAYFRSPSYEGFKALVGIGPDSERHAEAFLAYEHHYAGLGLKADRSCRNVAQACFVSYDPDAWTRPWQYAPPAPPPPPSPISTTTPPTPTPTIYTLHSTLQEPAGEGVPSVADSVERLKQWGEFRRQDPDLADLFEKHVEPYIVIRPQGRNEQLCSLVALLFRRVSRPIAERLCQAFLQLNRGVFTGSAQETQKSFDSLWLGCEQAYLQELNQLERAVYDILEGVHEPVFRILRDLDRHSDQNSFFMSCDELQRRVGLGCNGWRELRFFRINGIIEMVTPGTRREKGSTGKAAYYRWKLKMPEAEVTAIAASTASDYAPVLTSA